MRSHTAGVLRVAEGGGGAVVIFLEDTVEVREGADADGGADLEDAVLRFCEQLLCLADANEIEIFLEGRTRCLLENAAEIAAVEAEVRGDLLEGEIVAVIFVDVGEGGEDLLHLLAVVELQTVREIVGAVEKAEQAEDGGFDEHLVALALFLRFGDQLRDRGEKRGIADDVHGCADEGAILDRVAHDALDLALCKVLQAELYDSRIAGGRRAHGLVRDTRVDEDDLARVGGIVHAVYDAGQLSRENGEKLQLVVVVQIAGGTGDLALQKETGGIEGELGYVLTYGFVTHGMPFSHFAMGRGFVLTCFAGYGE